MNLNISWSMYTSLEKLKWNRRVSRPTAGDIGDPLSTLSMWSKFWASLGIIIDILTRWMAPSIMYKTFSIWLWRIFAKSKTFFMIIYLFGDCFVQCNLLTAPLMSLSLSLVLSCVIVCSYVYVCVCVYVFVLDFFFEATRALYVCKSLSELNNIRICVNNNNCDCCSATTWQLATMTMGCAVLLW